MKKHEKIIIGQNKFSTLLIDKKFNSLIEKNSHKQITFHQKENLKNMLPGSCISSKLPLIISFSVSESKSSIESSDLVLWGSMFARPCVSIFL